MLVSVLPFVSSGTVANAAHANSSASLHYSTQAVAAVRNVKRFTSRMTVDDFARKNLPDTRCLE